MSEKFDLLEHGYDGYSRDDVVEKYRKGVVYSFIARLNYTMDDKEINCLTVIDLTVFEDSERIAAYSVDLDNNKVTTEYLSMDECESIAKTIKQIRDLEFKSE